VALCAVCTVHVEMRSAGFFVEPQNQGRRFVSGWASKPLGWFSPVWPQNWYLILVLTIFVHTHILREEPDHSLSMLYGRKVIWLPNSGLRLYSCESLTLHFDQMGEARHSFTGPPHTHGQARMEAA
jgi:hypothetical protein